MLGFCDGADLRDYDTGSCVECVSDCGVVVAGDSISHKDIELLDWAEL